MFDALFDQFWTLTFSGIALGFIYVLIAMGYTMVYGVLRMINFANSEIFMVGAFATVMVSKYVFKLSNDVIPPSNIKLFLVILCCIGASMLASALLAFLVELVAYRHLRNRTTNRIAPLISAIGIGIVISEIVRILTGARTQFSPNIIPKKALATFQGAEIRLDNTITIIAGLILFIILDRFIKYSRLGKGIRAVSMDEDSAKLMGVNLNRVISLTFIIGGLMTGAAGFFYVNVYENVKFNMGFSLGLAAFTAAVIGGIGNIRGAFFGGISLGLVEIYASAIIGTQWKPVTVFIILILILLFKPNGIFGEAVQKTRV
jgi:branched-chain amino acid transport system permease protein